MARILLLEPDVMLANTYATFLGRTGYLVYSAHAAETAIQVADECQPHLVIMELQLATHNGIEFLFEFRSYAEWQSTPVLVHSMLPPKERFIALLKRELRVSDYHYKPQTTLQKLLESVQNHVIVAA